MKKSNGRSKEIFEELLMNLIANAVAAKSVLTEKELNNQTDLPDLENPIPVPMTAGKGRRIVKSAFTELEAF